MSNNIISVLLYVNVIFTNSLITFLFSFYNLEREFQQLDVDKTDKFQPVTPPRFNIYIVFETTCI